MPAMAKASRAPERCSQRRSPRDGGTRGFFGFLMGGTCDGEGIPSRERHITSARRRIAHFATALREKPRPKVDDRGFPTKGVIAGTITAISIA